MEKQQKKTIRIKRVKIVFNKNVNKVLFFLIYAGSIKISDQFHKEFCFHYAEII